MINRTNPKRHCMVVHAYYPLFETRVEREARALVGSGYEVDVLCLQDTGEPHFEVVNGVNVHRLRVKREKDRGRIWQLIEYLMFFTLVFVKLAQLYPQRRYKVVQAHNLPDFLIFAALVPRMFGARLILDLHDLMPEFFSASIGTGMRSLPVRLVIWQEQLSCRFAHHVITVTELWRERLVSRGVPPEKVSVVMNVADASVFDPVEPFVSAPNGNGHFNLIYHGALTYRYGVDILVRSIDIARRKIPGIHLTLQGPGDYAQELMDLVEELGLHDHITLNAFALPTAELPGLIRQANVGVVPNRSDLFTGELLPTKLLEYVALHVPVIAARTKVIETYFNDDMVQFFPAEDVDALARAIVHLYKHPDQRTQLAAKSNRFNETHAWENIARDYLALVDRLGTGHSPNDFSTIHDHIPTNHTG